MMRRGTCMKLYVGKGKSPLPRLSPLSRLSFSVSSVLEAQLAVPRSGSDC